MIGGRTKFDANIAALDALLAQWSGSGAYAVRVNDLSGGAGVNLSGSTVLNDHVRDNLIGGAQLDWFLASTVNAPALQLDLAARTLGELLVEI